MWSTLFGDSKPEAKPMDSALIAAVGAGDTARVQSLLDGGANKDAKDEHGDAALHIAARGVAHYGYGQGGGAAAQQGGDAHGV
eukprot:COSAG06_NODE_30103_length_544_cov_3.946067_1_plen_82_part_10